MNKAESIIREVEDFYNNFIAAFNRIDLEYFKRSFYYPNVMISGAHGVVVQADPAEQQRFHREQVMSQAIGAGWHRTHVDRCRVWPLADNMAIYLSELTRYKEDGSVLNKARYYYTVLKDQGAWKIAAITDIATPYAGPGNFEGSRT